MKFVGILFFIIALTVVSIAQTPTTINPTDLQVVKMSWKRETRPAREAYPKTEKRVEEELPSKGAQPAQSSRSTERKEQTSVYDNVTRPGQAVEDMWPSTGPLVSGYLYQITVRNSGQKEIKAVNWQYIFTDSLDQSIVTRHQFQSRAKIAPGKEVKLSRFSVAAPTQVVNAKAVANNPGQPYSEQVLITRIEYMDGSVWERSAE